MGENRGKIRLREGFRHVFTLIYRSYSDKFEARLNGGVLDNRALVADGRNKDKVLNLRDIAPMKQSPSRNPKGSTSSAATGDYFTNLPSPAYYNSDGSPTTPFPGQGNYEVCLVRF